MLLSVLRVDFAAGGLTASGAGAYGPGLSWRSTGNRRVAHPPRGETLLFRPARAIDEEMARDETVCVFGEGRTGSAVLKLQDLSRNTQWRGVDPVRTAYGMASAPPAGCGDRGA